MRTMVKKWGNSASVRIPAAVMQAAPRLVQQRRLRDNKGIKESGAVWRLATLSKLFSNLPLPIHKLVRFSDLS
jgi:hypothetical protein